MRITVVVCTWNRADALAKTLGSLASVRRPPGAECGTLVVDNGSTDGSLAIAREADALGRLHVVSESRPGLSPARNRALEECRALGGAAPHYVAWIDDDVALPSTWLEAYAQAFHTWPEAAVFGGPVVPELLGSPPDWLLEVRSEVAHTWSAIDLGAEGPLGPGVDRIPFGANFVVRLDAVGDRLFDETLGRTQSGLGRGGEEIRFLGDVLASGHSGRWVPDAGVLHQIGPDRQTLEYLRRYSTADGYDAELREAHPTRTVRRGRLLFGWARARLRATTGRLSGGARSWVPATLEAASLRGRLAASRGDAL